MKMSACVAPRALVPLILAAFCGIAVAQAPEASRSATGAMIYPAKGQTAKQQDWDRYECYDWSRQQSGFDPAQSPLPRQETNPVRYDPLVAGMIKGAASGAAIAELSGGDAGRGAAIGTFGATALGKRQLDQAKQQQAAQQQAVVAQQRSSYERAFAACMEGRGYVVR